jgi:hypothetical protein
MTDNQAKSPANSLGPSETKVQVTQRIVPGAPASQPTPEVQPAVAPPAALEPVAAAPVPPPTVVPAAPTAPPPAAVAEPVYFVPEVQEMPRLSIPERMNQLHDSQQIVRNQLDALEAALKKPSP